ncbi:MAG: VCBS repeat-containing protein [Bacteroidota bacterium]
MNYFKIKSLVNKAFILFIGVIVTLSCEQDDLGSETPLDQTVGANKVTTAYSVPVMQQALNELSTDPTFNAEDIEVVENYQYVRFTLPEGVSLDELEETADVFAYPIYGSDKNQTEEVEDGVFYGVIPVDGSFPLKEYTVLSSLYLPEHLADVAEREEDIARLEERAYEIAGWPFESGDDPRAGKWRPGGQIKALDGQGNSFPLPQLIVKIRKNITPNKWKTAITDKHGKFRWPGARPRHSVVYHFEYHTQSIPSVYYPPTEVGNLMPYDLRINNNRILVSSGKRRSQFNLTLGTRNDYDHVVGKVFAEALQQYLQFRDLIEKEITTEAFYMWQQATSKLYLSVSTGRQISGPFTLAGNRINLNFPHLGNRTRLDDALLFMQMIEAFEYHRLSNTGARRMDDNLKRLWSFAIAYEVVKSSAYNNIMQELNNYLEDLPHVSENTLALDLMDNEDEPNPIGVDGPLDTIDGFTWEVMLRTLKNAQNIETWMERLVQNNEASEKQIKDLYNVGFNGVYLFSEGRKLSARINSITVSADQLKVGDFNGDGKDDLFHQEDLGDGNVQGYVQYNINQEAVPIVTFPAGDVVIGDVNGDKRDDLLVISGTTFKVYYGPNWSSETLSTFDSSKVDVFRGADFDGDGKMDLIANKSGDGKLYMWWGCRGNEVLWMTRQINLRKGLIGDFYGNDTYDIVFGESGRYKVLYDDGGSGKETSFTRLLQFRPLDRVRYGDWNGNGQDDLIHFGANDWSNSDERRNWHVLNNLEGAVFVMGVHPRHVKIGDFNGDGKSDILYIASSSAD